MRVETAGLQPREERDKSTEASLVVNEISNKNAFVVSLASGLARTIVCGRHL